MDAYDVIVVGLGVMGGAAAYHCARRGARVLGLDANAFGHQLGSSHGATRAIRETYFEAPDYVPLVQRSFDMWRDLERDSGTSLLSVKGAVYVAPSDHELLKGVVSSAELHRIGYERLSSGKPTGGSRGLPFRMAGRPYSRTVVACSRHMIARKHMLISHAASGQSYGSAKPSALGDVRLAALW